MHTNDTQSISGCQQQCCSMALHMGTCVYKQVSRAETSNNIPQMWDVITCRSPWYLLLEPKFSYQTCWSNNHYSNIQLDLFISCPSIILYATYSIKYVSCYQQHTVTLSYNLKCIWINRYPKIRPDTIMMWSNITWYCFLQWPRQKKNEYVQSQTHASCGMSIL